MPKLFIRLLSLCLILLSSCETNRVIVSAVEEREANEIIIFLASKGISADKQPAVVSSSVGINSGPTMWSIIVPEEQMIQAMTILNQNGLPRKQGTNLLELFAAQGLMSSDQEEQIRYQAGLEQQIANMIRKIDGVIDADVQLSFPSKTPVAPGQAAPPQRVTASIYVKHQGIMDDPNAHLVSKIKRLVAASVTGLDINDVTVISDRSRFTDVSLNPHLEGASIAPKDYVSIWSVVMSAESAGRFQLLFLSLISVAILLLLALLWVLWKFYPFLEESGGLKSLFNPLPLKRLEPPEEEHETKP